MTTGKPARVADYEPKDFEGLAVPVYCPRDRGARSDCESLNSIIARNHNSFICCGERVVPDDDPSPQDKYRVCFVNEAVDDMQHYDKRDIIHTAAVLMGAAAVIEETDRSAAE